MAIERRNPLPKGKYWVDIIDTPKVPGARLYFTAWLARNRGKVKVIKKEEFGALITGKARDWYLFEVLEPVTWETDKGFGLPSQVMSFENPNAPVVTSSADTATRPEPPAGPLEQLNELFGDAKALAFILLGAYLLTRK
jgi:hypothetical protein